jgi:chromosome segregation ATPase
MTTPTETHYDLRRKVIFSDADEGAQLIADSEARAIWKQIEALQILCLRWDKLEKERDQLRAELATERARAVAELCGGLALGQENCDDVYEELRADCDELRADVVRLTARAERAEAELAKYLSACPASPTEEERKRCQQWWSISGRAS